MDMVFLLGLFCSYFLYFWLHKNLARGVEQVVFIRDITALKLLPFARILFPSELRFVYEAHRYNKSSLWGSRLLSLYVTLTEEHKRRVVKEAPHLKSKCIALHEGLNLRDNEESCYSIIEKVNTFKSGRIAIGYTGSYSYDKGLDILINALQFLPKQYCIVTAGRKDPNFEKLVKTIPAGQILDLGFIEHNQVHSLLRVMDILVLPNRHRLAQSFVTSPMKLFEYIESKVPIVASNLTIFSEILGTNHKYFYEDDSPEKLASSVLSLSMEYTSQESCRRTI